MLKLCFLLYADEIVIIAETEEELNKGLSLIKKQCDRWKLCVNPNKTKVMVYATR